MQRRRCRRRQIADARRHASRKFVGARIAERSVHRSGRMMTESNPDRQRSHFARHRSTRLKVLLDNHRPPVVSPDHFGTDRLAVGV